MDTIDYREQFFFSDIPTQPYPVYVIGKTGRLTNFKAMIYPNSTSAKKYTRKKQLRFRSQQCKIFDALINVGYFDPLIVYREFPIPIQNCYRLENQVRLFYMMDYYFPELKLAVELDSDYHDDQRKDPDSLRDEYLMKAHGITVFRIRDLQKESVQKTKFKDLTKLMRTLTPNQNPPLIFTNDLYSYLSKKGG
jgi:very-short-patch-repair endonuclease